MRATGKFGALALAILAGSVALPVAARSQAGGWLQYPTPEQRDAAYPEKARSDGVSGDVWLGCKIGPDGALKACGVSFEQPRGYGFGPAAVKLAAILRADPSVAGREVNVAFHLGPPAPDRPMRAAAFKASDGRFRDLAPAGPYWPDYALRQGLAGRAVLDCETDLKGRLSHCAVVQSSHPMFAWASLKMAEQGWMSAGATPAGSTPPADHIWRFVVDYPARTLADTH